MIFLLEPISVAFAIGVLVAYVVLSPLFYVMATTGVQLIRDELSQRRVFGKWGGRYAALVMFLLLVGMIGVLSIGLGAAIGTILGIWV